MEEGEPARAAVGWAAAALGLGADWEAAEKVARAALGWAAAALGWGWEAVGCRARRRMGAVTRSIDSHRARYVIQQNPQQSHGLCTRY